MDGQRFDAIARAWVRPATRRGLLAGTAGIGLLGLIWRLGAGAERQSWQDAADAADAECAGQLGLVDAARCDNETTCGDGGICVPSTAGTWRCIPRRYGRTCPDENDCTRDADCDGDEVCADLAGCCAYSRWWRRCIRRFASPRTTPPPPTPTRTADEGIRAQAAADTACFLLTRVNYASRCEYIGCPDGPGRCMRSPDGTPRCIASLGSGDDRTHACQLADTCQSDADCAGGFACVSIGGCCPEGYRNRCQSLAIEKPWMRMGTPSATAG